MDVQVTAIRQQQVCYGTTQNAGVDPKRELLLVQK